MDERMKLLTFPSPQPKPDSEAIEMLETWLQRIRSGEVIAVAIAGVTNENLITSSYYGLPSEVAGAVSLLQYRINQAIMDVSS